MILMLTALSLMMLAFLIAAIAMLAKCIQGLMTDPNETTLTTFIGFLTSAGILLALAEWTKNILMNR